MSSSPSTSPVFTIHREVKDAADSGDITNRALGMNMHGFKTGDIRVVPSANSNPTVEVLFWSGEAGKFVSRVHAVETGGFGDGVAFDLPFKAFGGVAFVKVKGGVGSGDTVTITMAGAQRQAAESDVLAWFDQVNYTNGDDKRYFWDPINYVLHGPFDANEIAWGWIYGERCVSVFEAVTETTGHTEEFAGNWTAAAGAILTADQITAPDPAKLADKLTFTAAAVDRATKGLGSATDNTNQTLAVWVCTASGTKQFRLAFLLKDGTTAISSNKTATTQWQRFDYTADILAGGTTPQARIQNDSGGNAGDIYIWGGAVYKDSSYPRQYRTNETGADQVQTRDRILWPAAVVPAAMLSGKWACKWLPAHDHGEHVSNFFARTAISSDFMRYITGNLVAVYGNAILKVSSNALTFLRNQLMALIMDAAAGSIEVSGATGGNGKATGNPWSWATGEVLFYAMNTSLSQLNGLISEPKKKAA